MDNLFSEFIEAVFEFRKTTEIIEVHMTADFHLKLRADKNAYEIGILGIRI